MSIFSAIRFLAPCTAFEKDHSRERIRSSDVVLRHDLPVEAQESISWPRVVAQWWWAFPLEGPYAPSPPKDRQREWVTTTVKQQAYSSQADLLVQVACKPSSQSASSSSRFSKGKIYWMWSFLELLAAQRPMLRMSVFHRARASSYSCPRS